MKESSKASKKTFKVIMFLELLIVVCIVCRIVYDKCSNNFCGNTITCIITLLVLGVIMPIIIRPMMKRIFESAEDSKKSREYVQQYLSKSHYTEVIPIKDEPDHEKFLTEELPKRAKFYALIMDDGTVCIFLKFNSENERVYYGGLLAEDFTTYFILK